MSLVCLVGKLEKALDKTSVLLRIFDQYIRNFIDVPARAYNSSSVFYNVPLSSQYKC